MLLLTSASNSLNISSDMVGSGSGLYQKVKSINLVWMILTYLFSRSVIFLAIMPYYFARNSIAFFKVSKEYWRLKRLLRSNGKSNFSLSYCNDSLDFYDSITGSMPFDSSTYWSKPSFSGSGISVPCIFVLKISFAKLFN